MDWLLSIPAPEPPDTYGYDEFISKIDAIVMGRKTFDFVRNVAPWPYPVPVFVLSTSLSQSDVKIDNVSVIDREPPEIVRALAAKGFDNLYIDGGRTIQSFLAHGLIDEMTITTVPIVLGSGIPLFGRLPGAMSFMHVATRIHSNGLVESTYRRA